MATLRQIKEQQQSVTTINKITKAMKLVSSAKSQKAIKEMKEYRNYFRKIEEVMAELIEGDNVHENSGTYWILVLSDLGLAGGYNSNVIKEISKNLKPEDELIVLGNKGASFAKKNRGRSEWMPVGEMISDPNFLTNLTTRIKTKFYDENKKVNVIYTEYLSQVDFKPVVKTILPIQEIKIEKEEVVKSNNEPKPVIEFEPSKEELLKQLESLYIHGFLVGVYKESQASEHTARKNAMDNASNNGTELLQKLDIEYNRGRQAKITQEISEIIGGAESLK